jgi:phosphorylcholine metabolism protein LicD
MLRDIQFTQVQRLKGAKSSYGIFAYKFLIYMRHICGAPECHNNKDKEIWLNALNMWIKHHVAEPYYFVIKIEITVSCNNVNTANSFVSFYPLQTFSPEFLLQILI